MFNYTHEVIINSLAGTLTAKAGTSIFPADAAASRLAVYEDPHLDDVKHLLIERGGDYRSDLVFPRGEGVVFATLPNEGRLSKLELTIPAVAKDTVLSLSVFVRLLDPAALSDYAYPNWASFGKPILVSVRAGETAADTADAFAQALKEAIPYNNKFVLVSVDGDKITLVATKFGLEFDPENVRLEALDEGDCSPCAPEKWVPVEGVEISTVKTIVPFGTAEMLIENYRFPTYGNRRWAALNSDETPIPGATYVMYSFAYDSPRPGFGGLSGVGQKVDAVTRHIFWVNSALKDAFNAALEELGVDVVEKKAADYDEDSSSAA